MNALNNEELKLSGQSFAQAASVMSDVAQQAAKNLTAAKESFVSGVQGFEQARAQFVEAGVKTLEQQVASASAFAQVKSPQEAFELQQKFAREALELYKANVSNLTTALTSGFSAAVKPLSERYAELSATVSKS